MNELSGELFRSLHQFSKLKMRTIAAGVSQSDFMTLMMIQKGNKKNGGITISELAKKLHVLASAMSRTLKGLEDRKLVERVTRKDDRRNTYVHLTKQGEELLCKIQQNLDDFMETVIEKVGEEDILQLVSCLDKLYETSRQEIELRKEEKDE